MMFIAAMAFSACDDDDKNDNITVPDAVSKALKDKYPAAMDIEWERKGNYFVADCWMDGREMDVWYDVQATWKLSKRLLNYILCIRFFIEVHSIVSASRFFHMPTYLRVVIECQSRFFPFFPAFSRNCPDYFLHTSGSSSFRSLSDLGAR